MTTTRCPACEAALPEGAPWCTLCFTDLRPREPEPAPAAAAAAAAAPVQPELAAVPAALSTDLRANEQLEPRPVETLTGEKISGEEISGDTALTWPCVACDHLVSLDLTTCPTCGSSFLGGEHSKPSLVLPVVGDVAELSPAGRYALMGAGAVALSGLLFLVLVLFGLIF